MSSLFRDQQFDYYEKLRRKVDDHGALVHRRSRSETLETRIRPRDGTYHAEFNHFLNEFIVLAMNGVPDGEFRIFRYDREWQTRDILRGIDTIRIGDTMDFRLNRPKKGVSPLSHRSLPLTHGSSEKLNHFENILEFIDIRPIQIFGVRGNAIDETGHAAQCRVTQPFRRRRLHCVRAEHRSQTVVLEILVHDVISNHVGNGGLLRWLHVENDIVLERL